MSLIKHVRRCRIVWAIDSRPDLLSIYENVARWQLAYLHGGAVLQLDGRRGVVGDGRSRLAGLEHHDIVRAALDDRNASATQLAQMLAPATAGLTILALIAP